MVGQMLDNSMIYTYKVTLWNHVRNFWAILIYIICFIGLRYYLIYRFGKQDLEFYNLICFYALLVFLIPQLVIHLTYYWREEGRVLFYNRSERYILIIINQREHRIDFEDIAHVERNITFALLGIMYQWMPWDNYNYSVIHLMDGRQFLVTSLLVPNMDLPLEENKVRVRKRFYCYPFGVKEVFEP